MPTNKFKPKKPRTRRRTVKPTKPNKLTKNDVLNLLSLSNQQIRNIVFANSGRSLYRTSCITAPRPQSAPAGRLDFSQAPRRTRATTLSPRPSTPEIEFISSLRRHSIDMYRPRRPSSTYSIGPIRRRNTRNTSRPLIDPGYFTRLRQRRQNQSQQRRSSNSNKVGR